MGRAGVFRGCFTRRSATEIKRQQDVRSISQNPAPTVLPDFRNLGVMLRVLVVVNLGAALAALLRNGDFSRLPVELIEMAAFVEPPLMSTLVLLYLIQPWLVRLSQRLALMTIVLLAVGISLAFGALLDPLLPALARWDAALRITLWSSLAAAAVLLYWYERNRIYSPALSEARLLALTARIRPHFFFNSLNAVLGVMRSEPRQAEQALESLADLFRVLMAENRELSTLGEELDLCRQYLELERLRLGDRLQVDWAVDDCPPDVRVPPLMLQPLIENAVYHGVEPSPDPACISVHIARRKDEVFIEITNPYHAEHSHHSGNRMALENIRERLMLFFDLEARLETGVHGAHYRVRIHLPYRRRGVR